MGEPEMIERLRVLIAVDLTKHKVNGDRIVESARHRAWYEAHSNAWAIVEMAPVDDLNDQRPPGLPTEGR